MPDVHILRVFTDEHGDFGDSASVVIDQGRHIPEAKRQAISRELNTGETAFINSIPTANVSIVHPQGEIDFAGVAALGAAWLLARISNKPIKHIEARGGKIETWQDGNMTWVRANLATMPPWQYEQLQSAEEVEHTKLKDTKALRHTMVWAWIDEAKGLIRARTFAADWDIPEAQGNGSGSMILAAVLGRSLEIRHGEGSVIFANPADSSNAEIGGRVTQVR